MTANPQVHPLFAFFGPRNSASRRILVIGQEPDSNLRMGTEPGPYALDSGGGTTFWTWSHKAIERAAGFPGLQLFHAAVRIGSSPIAYSDASPMSYEVGANALAERPSVTDAELDEHARNLLALIEARSCAVVVISGRKSPWSAFYDVAVPGFEDAGAVVVDVPFFGWAPGSNRDSLTRPLLGERVRPIIRSCVEEWAQANAIDLEALAKASAERPTL